MKRILAVFACSFLLATGPCTVDSWKLAFGPIVTGETLYGGVELEFNNGFDLLIPMVPIGDNLGGD